MLAAPAAGPSQSPASTTSMGASASGTGVPGTGIATCAASAIAITKSEASTAVDVRPRAIVAD